MERRRKEVRPRRSFSPGYESDENVSSVSARKSRSVGQVARDFDADARKRSKRWVKQAERDAGTRDDGGLTKRRAQQDAQLARRAAGGPSRKAVRTRVPSPIRAPPRGRTGSAGTSPPTVNSAPGVPRLNYYRGKGREWDDIVTHGDRVASGGSSARKRPGALRTGHSFSGRCPTRSPPEPGAGSVSCYRADPASSVHLSSGRPRRRLRGGPHRPGAQPVPAQARATQDCGLAKVDQADRRAVAWHHPDTGRGRCVENIAWYKRHPLHSSHGYRRPRATARTQPSGK